jgi:hypothetical protein
MVGGSLRVLRLLPPLKTGRHDLAEILLKVALNTNNQIKSNQINHLTVILNFLHTSVTFPYW